MLQGYARSEAALADVYLTMGPAVVLDVRALLAANHENGRSAHISRAWLEKWEAMFGHLQPRGAAALFGLLGPVLQAVPERRPLPGPDAVAAAGEQDPFKPASGPPR
jgi:hypothetical protein